MAAAESAWLQLRPLFKRVRGLQSQAENEKTLDQAAKELGSNALVVRADVSKLADLDRLLGQVKEKFGRIDVLFANAGIAPVMPFDHVTEEFFDAMFNINAKGVYFTVQKALPLLSKGASVILTTTAAVEKGMPGISVYAASKAAVRSLARSMSAELDWPRNSS